MIGQIRAAVVVFLFLSLITGVAYPLAVTGIGQTLFPRQAQGSLLEQDGILLGSELIGQSFEGPMYFWGRLSATAPVPYNGAASGGSNLGPTNPALFDAVKTRVAALREADPDNHSLVPVDLVTSSASGLDPHISLAAAEYQTARVARAREMPVDDVREIVKKHTLGRSLALFGEPRVNVLLVNLELDRRAAARTSDPTEGTGSGL